MRIMDKNAMAKRLGKANRDLEAVHLSVKKGSPIIVGHTVEEVLSRLTRIRADVSVVTSWMEGMGA